MSRALKWVWKTNKRRGGAGAGAESGRGGAGLGRAEKSASNKQVVIGVSQRGGDMTGDCGDCGDTCPDHNNKEQSLRC